MRLVVLAMALTIATSSLAAPSPNLDVRQECYRDAAAYLKLVRLVMARRHAEGEGVSPHLNAEFAQMMRSAKSWKTALAESAPVRHRASRSVSWAESPSHFVTRLRERLRTCRSLLPD